MLNLYTVSNLKKEKGGKTGSLLEVHASQGLLFALYSKSALGGYLQESALGISLLAHHCCTLQLHVPYLLPGASYIILKRL